MFDFIGKKKSVAHVEYRKRMPANLNNKLRAQEVTMENEGIIAALDYPTDGINYLQIVEKSDGSMYLCFDSTVLNSCIHREHFLGSI